MTMELGNMIETQMFNIRLSAEGELISEYTDGILTFDPAAPNHLRPRLIGANQKIQSLEADVNLWTDRYQKERSSHYNKKHALEELLIENAEDIDTALLKSIAEIFDIELTKTISFTATIEVKGELEINVWEDAGDALDDIELDVSLGYGSDGTIEEFSVTEIEEA